MVRHFVELPYIFSIFLYIMRNITKESIEAFELGINYKKSNTEVKIYSNGVRELWLHGSIIARADGNHFENLHITNAGYFTNTTKERLNGFPMVQINQKDFEWFLNGSKWSGIYTHIEHNRIEWLISEGLY